MYTRRLERISEDNDVISVINTVIMAPVTNILSTMSPAVSNGGEEDEEPYDLYISGQLNRYCVGFLFCVGIIGNVISFVVLTRAKQQGTTNIYLRFLLISDTLLLLTAALTQWLIGLVNFNIRSVSSAMCKFHTSITYFAFHFQAWVLVNLTIERYSAIVHPMKFRMRFTTSKALFGLGVIVVILALIDMQVYWTQDLIEIQGQMICTGVERSRNFLDYGWPIIDVLLTSIGPFIIMLVLTILIYRALHAARKLHEVQLQVNSPIKFAAMTKLLFALCIIFLLTTQPLCIYQKIMPNPLDVQDKHELARIYLIQTITHIIYFINGTFNFALYCVSSKKFRQDFLAVLGCRPTKKTSSSQTLVNNMVRYDSNSNDVSTLSIKTKSTKF